MHCSCGHLSLFCRDRRPSDPQARGEGVGRAEQGRVSLPQLLARCRALCCPAGSSLTSSLRLAVLWSLTLRRTQMPSLMTLPLPRLRPRPQLLARRSPLAPPTPSAPLPCSRTCARARCSVASCTGGRAFGVLQPQDLQGHALASSRSARPRSLSPLLVQLQRRGARHHC